MNYILLFAEGVLSAISPCVLPLLPLYIGYLTSNAKSEDQNGNISYNQKKVILYTLCFVLGIASTFVILTLSMMKITDLFNNYRLEFSVLGGIFVILMGLVQLEFIQIPFLMKDRRINAKLNLSSMNFITAFLMGFFFSFTWTPCIGPALSGVILMASNQSLVQGLFMIMCYTAGFSIPFLLLGTFTEISLNFIKKNQNILMKSIKVGGLILVCMGCFMTYQGFKSVKVSQSVQNENDATYFSLQDQNGKTHTLSMYKDKKVMITFLATWCTYCKQELTHIQELYNSRDDIVILTVLQPGINDISKEDALKWIEENNFTFPVLFDETGSIFLNYGVTGFPTSFFFDSNGDPVGYAPGYLDQAKLIEIINKIN